MYVEMVIPKGTEVLGRCVDECVKRIIGRWGGCTLTDCQTGYWTNPDTGLLDAEPVCTLGVDCGSVDSRTLADWFDNLAVWVREYANQHTVYYRASVVASRFIGPETIVRPVTTEGR